VPITLRDPRDSAEDRAWIRAVYRTYLSELYVSASRSGIFPALGEWDARENEFLASWFSDPTAHPFVIVKAGERVGFALVSQPPSFPRRDADYRMSELFVIEEARRLGVASSTVDLLFARFAGEWEVLEDEHNRPALAFWRAAIRRHTRGRFQEFRNAGEVRHRFRTGPGAEPGGHRL
jgi:predicted acetyltransferase